MYRILSFLLLLSQISSAQEKTSFKFSFGPGKEVPGYIKVSTSDIYSKEKGYGFDFGTTPSAIERGGKTTLTSGFCTSDKPFFFSVKLPAGNYDVKIIAGDTKGPSFTTVRAESRRLIFEKISTEPGKFATLTSTINIRTPEIGNTGEAVKRKPRELNKLNWDEKLPQASVCMCT